MPVSPTSKIQLVFHPPLPATCVVCNRSANGNVQFIDFGLNLDYYGAVVFCEDCIKNALDAYDYVPRETLDEALSEKAALLELNTELQENNVRLNATLDSLIGLRPGLYSDRSKSDGVDSESPTESDSGTEKD